MEVTRRAARSPGSRAGRPAAAPTAGRAGRATRGRLLSTQALRTSP
ncbi:hypothetical protein BSLA_02r0171 [Burkholderia stabilis]|nr:hypothetical protein BSLA_02r0171 [Burkholderia stabilis]